MEDYVFDLEDLPLDEWNGEDKGDTPNPQEPTQEDVSKFSESPKRTLSSARSTAYVPFKRVVKRGTVGNDALAVKRALSKAGFGKWGGWGKRIKLFGPYSVIKLKRFQKSHNLKVDGVYGRATHAKLAPYFDSYGRYLMGQVKVPKRDSRRDKVVNAAMFGYHHRGAIHYTQSSWRMYGVRHRVKPPRIPIYEDCSSFSTWCYWVAGAPDPNGYGYNGQGYTGTLIHRGKRVSSKQMKPGDLVFYGHYAIPSHVAVYVGHGRVVSHGSEGGPYFLPWNYRSDVHSIRSYL